MKLTRHNGRSGKHGTYNPKHNDRRFDVENSEHIDVQRTRYNQNHGRVKIIPLFEGEKNSNRTAGSDYLCSISAWSEQKEIAWDFLQFLTEHGMMSRQAMRDRSINLNVRDAKLAEATQKHIIDERLSEQYIREMDQVYDSVDRLYDMGKIKETLWLDLLDYLSGTATLDEALSAAKEAIWLSLNE